jgi:hypothetical protein
VATKTKTARQTKTEAQARNVLDAFVNDLRSALETQAMGKARILTPARALKNGIVSFDYEAFKTHWLGKHPLLAENMIDGTVLDKLARNQGYDGSFSRLRKVGSKMKKEALAQL